METAGLREQHVDHVARAYWHCREAATEVGAESDEHFTLSVPPWLLALHVPVQVTVHKAPDAQATLEPAPTVTVHWLPDSQATVADAPAVSAQLARLRQSRFALCWATTAQWLWEPHFVLHEDPQSPAHVVAPSQTNMQPSV